MATLDDVRRLALDLPQTSEDTGGHRGLSWRVKGKSFAWERPLGKNDIKQLTELGHEVPAGVILGARVPDEGAKLALVNEDPQVYFTIPHFDGYAAVLIKLDAISVPDLDEALTEAWLVQAPKRLAKEFLAQ